MTELNLGIVKLVTWLNEHGFETCDSGDGETHEFECDRPYPYAVIIIRKPKHAIGEANRLANLLKDMHGIEVQPTGPNLGGEPVIEVSYNPANQHAFIDLMGVHDCNLRQVK